jgi:hypothetical protein
LEEGDRFWSTDYQKAGRMLQPNPALGGRVAWIPPFGIVELDDLDGLIWLPTHMDYMTLLWKISPMYIMSPGAETWKTDGGILGFNKGSELARKLTKIENSPAEAWWKAVTQ